MNILRHLGYSEVSEILGGIPQSKLVKKSVQSLDTFHTICTKTPVPFCFVPRRSSIGIPANANGELSHYDQIHLNIGIVPRCYSRTVDIANTAIFQIGNAFVNIIALCVILIISYNIRFKYTAIGRSEYGYFFQLCFMLICITLVVDCGVSPPGSEAYSYMVAIQIGLAGACCWALSIMGFLGFRLWEDGTHKSMFLVRGISLIGFTLGFVVSVITFRGWMSSTNPAETSATALFIVMYGLNAAALLLFTTCQFIVSVFVLVNFWMTGSIILGIIFMCTGQALMYTISTEICEGVKHYIDGLFIGSTCNVFSMMMLYKTWDISTDDDLEFSVSVTSDGDVMYNSEMKM